MPPLHLSLCYVKGGWQKDLKRMSPDQAVAGMSHTHDVGMESQTPRTSHGVNTQETARALAEKGSLQSERNGHLVRRQSRETVHLRALIVLSTTNSLM